jgi:hypothetical protein
MLSAMDAFRGDLISRIGIVRGPSGGQFHVNHLIRSLMATMYWITTLSPF